MKFLRICVAISLMIAFFGPAIVLADDEYCIKAVNNDSEFFEKLAMRPIKFKERKKIEGTNKYFFTGIEPSLHFRNINQDGDSWTFLFDPDIICSLYKTEKDGWSVRIEPGEFSRKKWDDDYWLVFYIPGEDNRIHEALQFKHLADMHATFGANPRWDDMRKGIFQVYKTDPESNLIYWVAFKVYNGDRTEGVVELDDGRLAVDLKDGTRRNAVVDGNDGRKYIVKYNGIFKIRNDCVFNLVETKLERGLLTLPIIGSLTEKVRSLPLSKEDFFKRGLEMGIFFYYSDIFVDSTQEVIRVVFLKHGTDPKDKDKK